MDFFPTNMVDQCNMQCIRYLQLKGLPLLQIPVNLKIIKILTGPKQAVKFSTNQNIGSRSMSQM
ncbi:hypothetical protein WN51_01441 [Melipona quadrifasciata]|uniref:Uncharacterized protein n=1 Tax=Melipona quadrifasciata TaxID=166423 RepID=A0A0N0BET2_9HYME|nr:hypothetical protein WN51_01441 [Melipona quadrifasciata]